MDSEFDETVLLLQPVLARSPLDLARILVAEDPGRAGDIAAAGHRLACDAGDEDGALFWSNVLLLVISPRRPEEAA